MSDELVVDAEVVGTELEPQAPSSTLFRTDDPVQVIERATKASNALKDVLTRQNLTATIQGKEHVLVEGWTTLGSMLGVVPVVEWTRPLKDDKGWEARVEARTLDGRVVGAAEAECTRDERRWKSADDYALRSMAQTRATSKALRGPLGFIVTLAGFAATPFEEMPQEPQGDIPFDGKAEAKASQQQIKMLFAIAKERELTRGQVKSACGIGTKGATEKLNEVPRRYVDDVKGFLEAAKGGPVEA